MDSTNNVANSNTVSDDLKSTFDQASKYFPTAIQQFQFFDKYSRFDYVQGRRETWVETVERAVSFLKEISENKLPDSEYQRIQRFILEMKATPSMRLMAMAGDAARRNNICIYNCSFLPIDSIDSWVEGMLISMCGCGVGFSVEKHHVSKLPRVAKQEQTDVNFHHVIEDSTEGWMRAVKLGLTTWFEGRDVIFDYSQLRPAGTPLKIKGGRASGPKPLQKMLEFARDRILKAQGRKLTPLEAHDIMCEVGNAAVSGGMRRTAMISLFDWDDEEMRHAKDPGFEVENSQRWNANNSVVWPEDITDEQIRDQMETMYSKGNGEPGIFSRKAANGMKPARRKADPNMGTNPCGEISLRPFEFCNLTIAIARSDDDVASLREKVEVAAIIGTIQSMATNFPGLREEWVKNCKEERLLGVDINGQKDCPAVQSAEVMSMLRDHAVETNKRYAEMLGIPQSASVTCVKPGGNSSILFDTSNGLHARHYPFYKKNTRISSHSPVFKVLKDAGVPMNPENAQQKTDWETADDIYQTRRDLVAAKSACTIYEPDEEWSEDKVQTWVIQFLMRAPEGATTAEELTAVEQCEYWLLNKLYWTEHNPSVTIMYKEEEKEDLTKWMIEHKDVIGGMSFLPIFTDKYPQLPYEKISEEEYNELLAKFPTDIDFSRIVLYEHEDLTTAAQELACVSGVCEIPGYEISDEAKAIQA